MREIDFSLARREAKMAAWADLQRAPQTVIERARPG